jgi:hypothetical protein
MSLFLDLQPYSEQLYNASVDTLNPTLSTLDSLRFFVGQVSAYNTTVTLEYQSYPELVKHELAVARGDEDAPDFEEVGVFASEVDYLETKEALFYNKITTGRTSYNTFYTSQVRNLNTIKGTLARQFKVAVASFDKYQKSIISTIDTSFITIQKRQSVTQDLLTNLAPVNIPITKERLAAFISDDVVPTLSNMVSARTDVVNELQGAKSALTDDYNNSVSNINSIVLELSSENINITNTVNDFNNTPTARALRTRFSGVGNNSVGVLGYRYTSGKLAKGTINIGNVAFIFKKGLATRNNTLCQGWLGGIYYVEGFSTTLPSTGTGLWNGEEYVEGVIGGGGDLPGIQRGRWVVLSNNGGYLYVTKHFKIYAVFQANSALVNNAAVMGIIKDCYDYMSYVLRDSKPPAIPQPVQLLWDGEFKTNPLPSRGYPINEGYVISISEETDAEVGWLAYAGPIHWRPNTQQDQYSLTPSDGRSTMNMAYLNFSVETKMTNGKSQLYYVFLHEFMHALGIGTMWMNYIDGTLTATIYDRLFVVGAKDSAVNGYRGLYDKTYNTDNINVYYTSITNNDWRMNNTPLSAGGYYGLSGVLIPDSVNGFLPFGVPETVNQPPYAIDFNEVTSARNTSYAVAAYNEYFNKRVVNSTGNNFQLTAIPLQNDIYTVGVHWAEGAIQPGNTGPGGDNRQYYGQDMPGAPCMQNELMTPFAENVDNMACTKITLGALKDLGWEVDLDAAEQWHPTTHTIHVSAVPDPPSPYLKTIWLTDVNTTGGTPRRISIQPNGNQRFDLAAIPHLRPGVEYTIINNTDAAYLQAWYYTFNGTPTRIPTTWHTQPLSANDPLWYGKGAMTFTLTTTAQTLDLWVVGASSEEDVHQPYGWGYLYSSEKWARFAVSYNTVSPL